NPAYYRAVTTVAARDFGADSVRTRPADDALARRVFNADPLRTDLPVRPAFAAGDRGVAGEQSGRVTVARPARVAPPADLIERPTGAAARAPGVQLDNELRHTRILNGREGVVARPESPAPASGAGQVETRPTGAVTRPLPASRSPRSDPRSDTNGGERGASGIPDSNERPVRPERTYPRDVPVRPEVNEPERVPVRPERNEPPANVERPERHERPQAPRSDPAPPRYEPPVRNDP